MSTPQTTEMNPWDSDANDPQYIADALGVTDITPFDESNIDLKRTEYVLTKVLEYQTEVQGYQSAADAMCKMLRDATEVRCANIMDSAGLRSEGFVRRINSIVRRFGLSIKSQCMAAIHKTGKRSFKFESGVGVASLRTNNPRLKLTDDRDMESALLEYAKEYVPGAVRYTFEPLSAESVTVFREYAEKFNTAGIGVLVDVKAKIDKRELLAALELRKDSDVDETSGVISDTESVAIKGTDGLETVPQSLVIIKPEETFTLATPIGEIDLLGMEGLAL